MFCSGCPLDDFILCVFFFTSEPRSKSLVADIMYIIIVYIYIYLNTHSVVKEQVQE